nr:MAG TPA: hypothetical protein [Caudoviricetes sp.]
MLFYYNFVLNYLYSSFINHMGILPFIHKMVRARPLP